MVCDVITICGFLALLLKHIVQSVSFCQLSFFVFSIKVVSLILSRFPATTFGDEDKTYNGNSRHY